MKVLFVCKGNWYRSQMATAIYNKLTDSKDAISAGTYTGAPDEPEGQILVDLFKNSPHFFETMAKNGMDVSQNRTKRFSHEMLNQADTIVSMAEEPYIPDFLKNNKKFIHWKIENPKFVTKEVAEDTYQKISTLIQTLIRDNHLK